MIATSFLLIVWLLGFLFISSGLERSQQLRDVVLTVYREKRIAIGVGLYWNFFRSGCGICHLNFSLYKPCKI